jgi:UDP-N-acetylmuramate--alanine ligase
VLFQPHRYTRTQALMDDFARSFHQADSVHVSDIYAASETPIAGVSSQVLVEKLQAFGHRGASYTGSIEQGIAAVIKAAGPGDAIVTLGAGSVSQASGEILTRLGSKA